MKLLLRFHDQVLAWMPAICSNIGSFINCGFIRLHTTCVLAVLSIKFFFGLFLKKKNLSQPFSFKFNNVFFFFFLSFCECLPAANTGFGFITCK